MNLKDSEQFEKAKLEDTLIDLLYSKYKDLVFHGGTAIWRCYSGNRFSRDIDFYMKASKDKMYYYNDLSDFLKDCGFLIKEKSYERNSDTMHFLVESNTKMKIDINFKYKNGIPVEYLKVDGSKIIVLSLDPKELLNEKIEAYEDKLHGKSNVQRSEVQDLYDIYYLTTLVKQKDANTVKKLRLLVGEIETNPPGNLRSLGHLILEGTPPTFEFIINKLKGWTE